MRNRRDRQNYSGYRASIIEDRKGHNFRAVMRIVIAALIIAIVITAVASEFHTPGFLEERYRDLVSGSYSDAGSVHEIPADFESSTVIIGPSSLDECSSVEAIDTEYISQRLFGGRPVLRVLCSQPYIVGDAIQFEVLWADGNLVDLYHGWIVGYDIHVVSAGESWSWPDEYHEVRIGVTDAE